MIQALLFIAGVIVATWNGNWFPSGRSEHRAHPDVEHATTVAVGKMLANGLKTIDPAGTNDVIFCLNEIRGPQVASNLIEQIGRSDLRLASISGYRRRDRFDQQQDVIVTTLPIAESSWKKWNSEGTKTPPRGYAFAALVINPATTANVYSVHLKSNYRAKTKELAALNRDKRTIAIKQLLNEENSKSDDARRPVIIAGDMNTDPWREEFKDEEIFNLLEKAGFYNVLSALPSDKRGTYPSKRYGDSALDHIFSRGFTARGLPIIIPNEELSDHLALFVVFDL